MEQIRTIEQSALAKTRIKQALFPNLSSLGAFAFAGCAYLEVADIGMVTTIPERTFWGCARLHTVEWNPTKTETEGQTDKFVIGPGAFCQTRSLVDFKFLETARPEDVDAQSAAFFYSKIGISWKPDVNKAFPTTDNNTPFWEDAKYTPCEHRLVTKLSQLNPAWANKTFLSDRGTQYQGACALFAVMHIHSAISGKYYNHPDEFVEELKHNPELSRFLYYRNWPGYFKNVASMFEALGYRTEVHGNGSELSTQNFQALLDALKAGAYIYTQVATLDNYEHGVFDRGHAVVLYGINEFNEVCVLDSNVLHEDFREGGFDPDIDVYTYAMPYQNMVGPGTDFVIVYPPRKHPMQEPHKK